MGMPAQRPVVEMTIPSALDKTISPPGKHVVQLFVQFAPYHVDPKYGNWADPVCALSVFSSRLATVF